MDLPGLFLAGNKNQSVEDAKLVESLVLSYMEQPRSIILAVVSTKSEFSLQQVTRRARENDPDGTRTLGLITKPDTLHQGSESEQAYFELAQNTDVKFRLGWHVVRNRDLNTRHATKAERDAAEKDFFSRGVWVALDPSQLGVDALRIKLSKVLHDQIVTNLPSVLNDIRSGISKCKLLLEKLGTARDGAGEQRRYLLQISQTFTTLVKASIEGDYSDRSFFGDSATQTGCEKRLRARIQNTLMKFAETMRLRGHTRTIIETEKVASGEARPVKVLRSRFVKEVNDLIQRNLGRELPGTFNPLIVGEMFSVQCQPWEALAKNYVETIVSLAHKTLLTVLKHVADCDTGERLAVKFVNPAMIEIDMGRGQAI